MTHASRPGRTRVLDAGFVLAVALALTMLNVVRPVAVDDPAYLRQAAWWAAHPSDPLGGEAPHYQSMVPAAQVAAAPVAIAWLALGTALTGGAEWALKLWLLPFAWLLAWSLHALLRLVAPTLSRPWLAAAILSPWVLPSFGFLLDVPMLALALGALAMFARGGSGDPWRSAIAAGVLAGLALQTKYTAAPILVALASCGALTGRRRAGLLACAVALAVFAAIEAALFAGAGTTPLLAYIAGRGERDPGGHFPLVTARRLMGLAGSAAPALIPLGLTALGAPRRAVHLALGAVVLGFGLLAFAPVAVIGWLDGLTHARIVNFENVSIGWMGPALGLIAAVAVWRTVTAAATQVSGSPLPARALAAWLGAECALAPFVSASGSVRRVLGALAALSLVLARLAHEAVQREPARRADVLAGAVASVALGLSFWTVGVDSALADRRALALVRERLASEAGRVAYVGDHWTTFEHDAAGAGLRRVALGGSRLRAGDWLVVPFAVGRRNAVLDSSRLVLVDSVPLPHRLPVTTRRSFYDGRLALRRVDPAWVGARLWRVTAEGEVLRPRVR